MKKIFVENLRGEKEPFSFRKVFRSARNSGAPREIAFEIARQIKKEIFPGISTSQISDRVFELLFEKFPQAAIKFNLKRAMIKLGPTGYPFEKFIGKVFQAEGYEVKTNVFIPGICLKYEIDFVAKKGNFLYLGECKFRHERGGRVDLQVALANYARFLDIKRRGFLGSKRVKPRSILVTNAKFTTQAIKYSECSGVKLLGWKYPRGEGLEKIIEGNQLYPITILPSVNETLAKVLIENNVILVEDVFSENFEKLKFPKKERIQKEAEILLK